MKKIILISIFVVSILGLTGCHDEEQSKVMTSIKKIKDRGYIKIGIFADKTPFGYIDENGAYQGYDVYFAKRIAKDLLGSEKNIEFVPVKASQRAEFLIDNKVDLILANYTRTTEREQIVDFAMPYMKVALGIAVPKNSKITDIEQLIDKKVIVNKGTTADLFFIRNHPEINLLKFDTNAQTFQALLSGEAEAVAHDNTILFAWVRENPNFKIAIQSLGDQDVIAPAVKKGNKDLLNWLNDEIIKLYDEKFFYDNYRKTLKNFYNKDVDPNTILIGRL